MKKSAPIAKEKKSAKSARRSGQVDGAGKFAPAVAPSLPGRWINADDLSRLHDSLREAQDTLEAIRNGEVDAVVVAGSNGNQIYSLAGAEQPYRVYVERMREGAVTVSADGLILYCNQCFADMVRTPLERAISSDIRAHLPQGAWDTISAVFDACESVEHECRLEDALGGVLPVKLSASSLPLESQKVMCLVVTDLSAQQEQEKLRMAKEVAETASLAKDAFLAALSHELRTPLTPALIAAMSLENDPGLPDYARQDLSMIRRNVELETRLIDDLLDLTRIANGKFELHKATVDFHALLTRAWEICDAGIKQKSIEIDLRLEAHETVVFGDPVRLQQAIWNVIRNAVKFTPERGTISIATMNSPGKICLVVKDSGIGFEPAAAATLFGAFEQTGRDITRRFGGLGLGLAISRSIVNGHGGVIRAESPGPHKGATFTIEMQVTQPEMKLPERLRRTGEKVKMRQLRILLVEDHEDSRRSMQKLLQTWDHHVKAAPTAKAALDLAAAHPFDLVISDLGLPDETGAALMRKLRDHFGLQGIAVSGFGMDRDVAESEAAGFIYHLTKPVQTDRLRELIGKIAVPKA